MKYLLFLLIGLSAAACGTNRHGGWKLVSVPAKPSETLAQTTEQRLSSDSESIIILENTTAESNPSPILGTSSSESLVATQTMVAPQQLASKQAKSSTPDLEEVGDEDEPDTQAKVDAALMTEKIAKRSLTYGIISLVTFLFPFVPVVGTVMTFLAISSANRAMKARYITEKGDKYARTGLILGYIGIGLRIIALIVFFAFLLVILGLL